VLPGVGRALAACALALASAARPGVAAAAEWTAEVRGEGNACGAVTLTALSPAGEAVAIPLSNHRASFKLAETTDWTLVARAAGCWAEPLAAPHDASTRALHFELVPGAIVTFRRSAGARGRVRLAASRDALRLQDALDAACEAGAQIRCAIPAGVFNVRIEQEPFAPVYLWDLSAAPHATVDAGELPHRITSSISGWVRSERSAPVAGAAVSVTRGEADASSLPKSTTNQHGFFQLLDVPVGSLAVHAKWKSAAASAFVSVTTPGELRVGSPLRLRALPEVRVFINPPVEPSGLPWTVRLDRRTANDMFVQRVLSAPATASGTWQLPDVEPGDYVLSVFDANEDRFHWERLTIGETAAPLFVELHFVAFEGHLTVGDKPAAGEIEWFSSDGSAFTTQVRADGKLRGTAPRAGVWKARVTLLPSQTVHMLPDSELRARSDGTPARVDFELPAGRVAGVVVNEAGDKIAARVMVTRENGRGTHADTDSGTFAIEGLDTGEALIGAQTRDGESGLQPVSITEDGGEEVRLVISQPAKIAGRLLDPVGRPVPGAIVRGWSPSITKKVQDVSGLDGTFVLRVPKQLDAIDLVVVAPELPVKIVTVALPATRVDVRLGYSASTLLLRTGQIPPWPLVGHDPGRLVPLGLCSSSLNGAPLAEMTPDGLRFQLEAGEYSLCMPGPAAARCRLVRLLPNAVTAFDME
jgi:hypothetical protein